MLKAAATAAAVAVLAIGASALTHGAPAAQPAAAHPAATAATVALLRRTEPVSCIKKAPTTTAGYTAMFAALPTALWGAADGAESLKVGARSVWFFGDTASTGRFVHSTAITQAGGCLHVSHGGAQLLPNDNPSHIYWIESARAVSATRVDVTARTVTLTGTGGWDFADGGYDRTAVTSLNATGDLTFSRWGPKVASPVPNPGPMYVYGPHHFGYGRHTHPELPLASHKMLVSTNQNWDDGHVHPYSAYRTLFTQS
jgi:hypothetical protein